MSNKVIHGIVLGRDHLAFATMERAKDLWRVTEHDRVAWSAAPATEGESVEAAENDALRKQLLALAPRLKGECSVALPADRLLLRVVDLPTTDPEEIQSMIQLQIEKISPFPVDRLVISHERLSEQEGASRVLIAGARREDVDRVGEAFHGASLTPRWLDVDLLGWWHWLTKMGRAAKFGREVILFHEAQRQSLIVAQSGVPLALRALPDATGLTPDEKNQMLIEEVEYTLTSLESEWGGVDHTHYALWHADEAPTELAAGLKESTGAEVPVHSLDELPPLSQALAERAAERDGSRIDLAPPEWASADAARSTLRTMILATSILLGVWLLLLGAFHLALGVRRSQLAKVRAEREALVGPVSEVRQIRDKVMFLRRYTDRTFSSLEVLREVAIALPAEMDLSNFTYNKSGSVTIHGEAGQEDPIYKFVERLQQSTLFSEVKLDRVEKRSRQGEVRSIFRITARMQGEAS